MKMNPAQANSALKITVLLCLITLLSCGSVTKLDRFPAPPAAEKGIKYPEFNTEIDLATNFIVADLKRRYGEIDTLFYTLSEPSSWSKIVEFYDAELKKRDFARVSEVPQRIDPAQAVYYEGGVFSKQRVVISLIEVKNHQNQANGKQDANKYQFLMIGTNRK